MTTTDRLPKAVVQAEKAMSTAGFDSLAAMRWHYVGNPDNDERVTITAYAEQTGVSRQAVSKSAKRYASDHGLEYATVRPQRANNASGSNGTASTEVDNEPPATTKATKAKGVVNITGTDEPVRDLDVLAIAVAHLVDADPSSFTNADVDLLDAAAKALRALIAKAKKAHLAAA